MEMCYCYHRLRTLMLAQYKLFSTKRQERKDEFRNHVFSVLTKGRINLFRGICTVVGYLGP